MTNVKARLFIREHLKKRGNHRVKASERLVVYWWTKLNASVFHGCLDYPYAIEIGFWKKAWAYTIYNNSQTQVKLQIQECFVTRKLFLTVLVHEMVHAWEHMMHTKVGHGKRFYSWQSRIHRTIGLELNECIDERHFKVSRA